jgi:alkylation response protein AidB-like acyl-CoA dehydrogenase
MTTIQDNATQSSPAAAGDVSAREQEVIDRAEVVAADVLAKNAPRYDQDATFPADNFAAMHEAGFIGVVVPEEYGGLGLRPVAYSRFLKALAKGCASTAGSYHMHNSSMRTLEIFGTEEQKQHFFGEAVERGALFGSWGAEPASTWAGSNVSLTTSYAPAEGGYKITGSKYFASLGEGAAYGLLYCVPEEHKDSATIDDITFFVVSTAAEGCTVIDNWDPIGMRATVSKPIELKECFVPSIAKIGQPGDIKKISTEFYSLGYATFYQGIAEAAFAHAVHHAQTRTVRPSNKPIGHFERVQRKIGEMSLVVHAGALAVDHAARTLQYGGGGPLAALHASLQAKAITTTTALTVTSLAMEVAGGPGAIRGNPFERLFRDARTATLMVPAYDQCLETVAKNDLGFATREFN